MALSVVVKLLDADGTVLVATQARHWQADAVRAQLDGVKWNDESQHLGFSDLVADVDAKTALSLHESFRPGYLSWIEFFESAGGSDYAKVGNDDKAQLAALDDMVRRADAEGLKVRLLLEEWSSRILNRERRATRVDASAPKTCNHA